MRKIDQIIDDECWPCCVAMVLDRPRRTVPYRKPVGDPGGFRDFWEDWFKAEGIEIASFVHGSGLRFAVETRHDRLWIATVPGARNLHHAVVMRGAKLYHDPYRWNPRKRRPTKILHGTILSA